MKERKWGVPYGCPARMVAFLVVLLSACSLYAQSTAVVARASGVTGQAVLLSPGMAPLVLTAGYILNPGDRIDTRGGGRVVIDLSDGSMVVVAPESIVTLKDYRAAESLRELFSIALGMVRVKINHFAGKPNPYRMNSPTASIAVRGTEFSIAVDADGGTEVDVYEGAVEVVSLADPNRRVLIEAGRGVLVQGGQDFHLIGANGPPAGDRAAAQPAKPGPQAGARAQDGTAASSSSSGAPPQAPAPQAALASQSTPGQGSVPQGSSPAPSHGESEHDDTPRAGTSPPPAPQAASVPQTAPTQGPAPPSSNPQAATAQAPTVQGSSASTSHDRDDTPHAGTSTPPPLPPLPSPQAPSVPQTTPTQGSAPPSPNPQAATPQAPTQQGSGASTSHGGGDREDTPRAGSPPVPAPPGAQGTTPQTGSAAQPTHAQGEDNPRASASTYDRYLAGLVDIAQVPFLLRFNAFAESHLDSLENPAYSTEFHSPEGRVFILPTFKGTQTLQEYQSTFGSGGTLPGNYSVSPQVSFFAPAGGFVFGGGFSASRVGDTTLTATPNYAPGELQQNSVAPSETTGSSSGTFYTGALVAARRFGANSFGIELANLKGTGSSSSVTRTPSSSTGPGHLAEERSQSTSDDTQTRLTAGFSRDLSRDLKLGVFYRYAFIRADDHDVSHTLNGFAAGLNATRTTGHSSEFGLRLRGLATPRLSYGFTAAWLGVSLLDGMNRITAVNSHERDRAQRGSAAFGLGYALTRRTTLTFDLAGGSARTWAARTEDSTRALLQNAVDDSRFVSAHAAVQADLTRRLFATASFLNIWQSHNLSLNLFPDRFGNIMSVEDSFFPLNPSSAQYAPRFSDFGVGWRFTRNLFAQYVYSTDYGSTAATHTLMLRYTFHPRD